MTDYEPLDRAVVTIIYTVGSLPGHHVWQGHRVW